MSELLKSLEKRHEARVLDGLFEESRRLLGTEEKMPVGAAILINELFEAIEMSSDMCEDACDQVRIIIIRR